MKNFFLLCCCLCLATFSVAQKKQRDTIDLGLYQNEMGLDMQNILNKVIISSVIYKRKINKEKESGGHPLRYWRFGASLGGDFFNFQDSIVEVNDRQVSVASDNDLSNSIFIGREWVYRKWNRFSLYCGTDLSLGFMQIEQSFKRNSSLAISTVDVTGQTGDQFIYHRYHAGLSPFLGAKFHFHPRFFVGVETSLDLIFQHERFRLSPTSISVSDFEEITGNFNSFRYALDQLNMLVLGYYF